MKLDLKRITAVGFHGRVVHMNDAERILDLKLSNLTN